MAPLGVLRASLGPQVADVEVGVVSYGGQFTLGFSQCQLHRWARLRSDSARAGNSLLARLGHAILPLVP